MKWATSDDLGAIAFQTKKQTLAAYPSRRAVRCEFAFGFLGWLALDHNGTQNGNTAKTPDGREVPVVSGWCQDGELIGMRGGRPLTKYAAQWREIMARVVDVGLALNEYKRAGNG